MVVKLRRALVLLIFSAGCVLGGAKFEESGTLARKLQVAEELDPKVELQEAKDEFMKKRQPDQPDVKPVGFEGVEASLRDRAALHEERAGSSVHAAAQDSAVNKDQLESSRLKKERLRIKARDQARKDRLSRGRQRQKDMALEEAKRKEADKIVNEIKAGGRSAAQGGAADALRGLGQQHTFDVVSQFIAKINEGKDSSFSLDAIAERDFETGRAPKPAARQKAPGTLADIAAALTAAGKRGQPQSISSNSEGGQSTAADALMSQLRSEASSKPHSMANPTKVISQDVASADPGASKAAEAAEALPKPGDSSQLVTEGQQKAKEGEPQAASFGADFGTAAATGKSELERQVQPGSGESKAETGNPQGTVYLRGSSRGEGLAGSGGGGSPLENVPLESSEAFGKGAEGVQIDTADKGSGSGNPAGEEKQAGQGSATLDPPTAQGLSIDSTIPKEVSEAEWRRRQAAVIKACKESWGVYAKYAMGADELTPLTLEGRAAFGDLGAMVVDSLDTLWMFGLTEEFQSAKKWVEKKLNFDKVVLLSLFETTIRILGGLVSIYDLTGEELFLQKAQTLIEKLMIACDEQYALCTNEVHLNAPDVQADLTRKNGRWEVLSLAEFGSLQMEFAALSHRTGIAKYAARVESSIERIDQHLPDVGLPALQMSRLTGLPPAEVNRETMTQAVGAMADSYIEYLLKMWLLGRKSKEMYRRRWERAIDETIQNLTSVSPGGLLYVSSRFGKHRQTSMEHLSCFLPGNVALGAMEGAVGGDKAARYLAYAEQLTFTCWQMYEKTATGLGLEIAEFSSESSQIYGPALGNRLRPETVESFFYLWRATGKQQYRDAGWAVFEAFQKHSRTPQGAYAGVMNVNSLPVKQLDSMETFWTAETLKYLWLLFGQEADFDFTEFVLNTEAHPLRIFTPGKAGN